MAIDAMLESKVTYIKHVPDALTAGKYMQQLLTGGFYGTNVNRGYRQNGKTAIT